MMQRKEVGQKLVGQWTGKAEDDFRDAGTLLSQEPPSLGNSAFHSQQCAEKYLKAFLTRLHVAFPKTHNIGQLLDIVVTKDKALADSLRDATALNPYGVGMRYPGDFPEMTPALAKEAVDLASKVRDAVRERLRDFHGEP